MTTELAQAGLIVQLNRILENTRRCMRENAVSYAEAIDGRWVEATAVSPRRFVVPANPPTVEQVAGVVQLDARSYLRCLGWIPEAIAHEVKEPMLRAAMDAHDITNSALWYLHQALLAVAHAQLALQPATLDDLRAIPSVLLPLLEAAPAQLLHPELDWWWESQRAHEHVAPEHSLWPV